MILDAYGKPIKTASRRVPVARARYDAAQTTNDNKRHWANADGLSADAANSAAVREKLRRRARYEVANNSYGKGIVLTLANDTIGTGPRLQLLSDDDKLNASIEAEFASWTRSIHLARKLRTMRMAKVTDGEVFALMMTNPGLPGRIQLDLVLIEADRVKSPWEPQTAAAANIDGILLDDYDNPVSYSISRRHPGDSMGWYRDYDQVSADAMIHWFRLDRPGQHRGVPEITPALPLFAQLRRFTLAVLAAAETAADFAAVLYTDAPANGDAAAVDPLEAVELEQRMATTLPEGWRLGQIEAQQPATTYGEFKRELLNEIIRCILMPQNVAIGNSADYNYASGRLDHQTYFKAIRVEQGDLAEIVLDRIFRQWYFELSLTSDYQALRQLPMPAYQWFWDGTEHVDPLKEANAQAKRLESNTTTLAREFARDGRDWEEELRQRARETELMRELGIGVPAPAMITDGRDTEEDKEDEKNEAD